MKTRISYTFLCLNISFSYVHKIMLHHSFADEKTKLVRSLVLYVKLGVRYLAALRLALRISTFR